VGYDSSLNGNVSIGNDLTIVGRLNVRQYSSQNIINTTTTNYQLIVSEDLSLNGRMYVRGNVGIGRSGEPFYTLDVSSEASTQPFRVGVGSTNALVVDNNGRVGIGKADPAVALDVNGVCKSHGGFVSASGFKSLTQSAQVIHTFRGGHAILTLSSGSNYYGIFYLFWTPNLTSPIIVSLGTSNLNCSLAANLEISAWVGGSVSRNAVWNIMYLQVPDYLGNNSVT
jgi:hypothetical protein